MSVRTGIFDRFRIDDRRLVEYTLAIVLTAVIVVAVSWAVDAAYEPNQQAAYLYLLGAFLGGGIAIALRLTHPLGFFGAIVYFGAVVGDVLIAGSGFQGPLGVWGAIGLFVLGTTLLVLCRGAFFTEDWSIEER